MNNIDEFKKAYVSYPNIFHCGRKLFSKLAIISETSEFINSEIKENFSDVISTSDTVSSVKVNDDNFYIDVLNKSDMDILMAYVIANPQVKISYEIKDFRFLIIKLKNKSKIKDLKLEYRI